MNEVIIQEGLIKINKDKALGHDGLHPCALRELGILVDKPQFRQ